MKERLIHALAVLLFALAAAAGTVYALGYFDFTFIPR